MLGAMNQLEFDLLDDRVEYLPKRVSTQVVFMRKWEIEICLKIIQNY